MKERIVVKNFSVIDSIEMDVKPFTILIGPQSSGKSLMAKLVYFFKYLPFLMVHVAGINNDKRQLSKMIRQEFNKIFPEYLLKTKVFKVTYFYGDKEISITSKNSKSYKSYKISFSPSISTHYTKMLNSKRRENTNYDIDVFLIQDPYHTGGINDMNRFLYGGFLMTPIFIPAGRSYFANVKERIFSYLLQDVNIDYMLQIFGGFWESFKRDFKAFANEDSNASALEFFPRILGGEYKFDKEKEWIEMNDKRAVLLEDSSSGQQEIIPLLVSLSVMRSKEKLSFYSFVEEPEAHLFPESQDVIVQFLATMFNAKKRGSGFFITTHSPYILSSFNNLIQGKNAFNEITALFENGEINVEIKETRLEALDKLLPPNTRIDFDDVAVYEVKKGTCKDIKNYEHKLIDATVIDEVSNKTARTFDGLLDIAYGE